MWLYIIFLYPPLLHTRTNTHTLKNTFKEKHAQKLGRSIVSYQL